MNENIKKLVDRINDIFTENETGLTNSHYDELSSMIESKEDLAELLPLLKKQYGDYENKIEQCDKVSKDYTESKKMWKSRGDQLVLFIGHIMDLFKLKSYAANNTKVTVSVREILETDNDALLAQFNGLPEYKALELALPVYAKINLSIDKTALKMFIKNDSKLMIDHPEWVHTKESKSVSLK